MLLAMRAHTLSPAGPDFSFGPGCFMSDANLEASLQSLGQGVGGHVEFVFVNGCASAHVAERLHALCGIPVAVGWNSPCVPGEQCMALVRRL